MPKLAHLRVDGLGGEKVMPQIHILRVVPVVRGHVGDRVALVIGGVIDQYRDRTEFRARFRDRRLERRDVGDVAAEKERRLAHLRQPRRQRLALVALEVDKRDARMIAGKSAYDVGADAGRAAADEHRTRLKAGIGSEGQAEPCRMRA